MKLKVVSGSQAPSGVSNDPQEQIKSMIEKNPVFLFMKGTPDMPQCGFSAKTSQILAAWNVKYDSFNVLSDQGVREGVKSFSNWPTIPQLYVNNEFVGGCDIITELSESGELGDVLKTAYPDQDFAPPPPPAEVQTLSATDAKSKIDADSSIRVLDVRSPEEWEMVHLEGSQLIDQELVDEMLSSWDKNAPIMLICHHGIRSFDAARFFTSQGFQNVSHVEGGIDDWAKTVDSNLAQY